MSHGTSPAIRKLYCTATVITLICHMILSQSKMSWLRRYMRQCQEVERQLRQDMKVRLSQETSEKSELIAEIKRQQETMDEMSEKHRELVDDVISKEDQVNKLEVCYFKS